MQFKEISNLPRGLSLGWFHSVGCLTQVSLFRVNHTLFTLQGSSRMRIDSLFRTHHTQSLLVRTRHNTVHSSGLITRWFDSTGLIAHTVSLCRTITQRTHFAGLITQRSQHSFTPCLITQFHSAKIIAHIVSLCRAHKVLRLKTR